MVGTVKRAQYLAGKREYIEVYLVESSLMVYDWTNDIGKVCETAHDPLQDVLIIF